MRIEILGLLVDYSLYASSLLVRRSIRALRSRL